MTARRPPPLAASLFAGGGPLAPGSAKAVISPSRLHPKVVVDSHYAGLPSSAGLAGVYGGKQPGGLVMAYTEKGIESNGTQSLKTAVKPLVLGQDPAQYASTASAPYIPLVVDPRTHKLESQADWDELERTVEALSTGRNLEAAMSGASLAGGSEEKTTPIVIAGVLPPLLQASTAPRQIVQTSQFAELWQPRLASLSLNKDVYLQLLPPMVDTAGFSGAADDMWWQRAGERDEAVRINLAHALECFGAHRILFGTGFATAYDPGSPTPPGWEPLVINKEWYALVRGCLADLVKGDTAEGVDSPQNAMDDVFGAVAKKVYGL